MCGVGQQPKDGTVRTGDDNDPNNSPLLASLIRQVPDVELDGLLSRSGVSLMIGHVRVGKYVLLLVDGTTRDYCGSQRDVVRCVKKKEKKREKERGS